MEINTYNFKNAGTSVLILRLRECIFIENMSNIMKQSKILVAFYIVFAFTAAFSQTSEAYPQPTDLITIPTAGIIPRGAYLTDVYLTHDGGLTAGINVGITDHFMFGISYGGNRIIGDKKVEWNPQPGIEIKYRFFDETQRMPAILLGFNSQGSGAYIDSLKRYENKAKGFYVVASKNYMFLGNTGLHCGVNYNPLEKEDGDRDPSFFLGIDKDLNDEITIMVEYDAALNDNEDNIVSIGQGKGYLNGGLRWCFADKFHIELDCNNILLNRQNVKYMTRELKITFVEFF